MIAKCPCEHCGVNIEFATEEFLSGSAVTCPTCGKETRLFVSPQGKPAPKPAVPVPTPPQKFTAPGAAYRQKSSTNFLPWIIVVVLVVANGFLAVNFSHEHAQRILLESQLAEEKLKAAQADATGANRAVAGAEIKQQLAEAKKDVRDAVAGIYEFEKPGSGMLPQKMDLRSDGTGITCQLYHGYEELYSRKTTWSFGDNKISVESLGQFNPFVPEGDDLIDSRGNRWIRTH